MNIVYPASILHNKKIDECFIEESNEVRKDFHVLNLNAKIACEETEKLLYRGWMLSQDEYLSLHNFAEKYNYSLITSMDQYYQSHHMHNWYDRVKEQTPKTWFFESLVDLKNNIDKTGLTKYFVKDSVKSLTTKNGSVANNKEELFEIIEKIEKFKGLEGFISIREVHNFIPESEIRYFSVKGNVFSPLGVNVSDMAKKIADKFSELPFISIDMIKDENGQEWLVEIGDGQVSDIKMWDCDNFVKILKFIK